ncbi:hypothetical protein [Pseudofrankia inefficax]|uniref:Resolvase/invertase-type recombinase catalytic domain-containing protein n=1 Tax=Pseudofrankia inefficax (strain DSM 45817 / CECT 9037 / DDB 130130 / EuI1c) TaxID=298654 RepID=E3J626_PSEI1|nr:hypothetical protein [Pseudofrankia inefficax]ADP78317.1 hypothetical protein FraEuI1c_0229 [Pseudofrankia inefficax]
MAMMADGVRALSFTRHAVGSMRELPVQRAVFTAACEAHGWSAGGSVCQIGRGLRAWWSVVRMVRSGAYDVVVVDTWERMSATEAGQLWVLALLQRSGVRLLVARDGIDTGDPVGHGLGCALLDIWGREAVAR